MKKKSNILLLQPYITNYRLPIFKSFSKVYKVVLCSSFDSSFDVNSDNNSTDFTFEKLEEFTFFNKRIFWQSGLIKYFLKEKPDILFITANPRYISTWLLLILSKIFNKKIFLHGQGLYSKEKISIFNKIIFFLFNKLCNTYICYTKSSKDSLEHLPIYKKSKVAENSILNNYSIRKTNITSKNILFIGRLRKGSNLELLINVITSINAKRSLEEKIFLEVVGGGDLLEKYKKDFQYDWITFHGVIYDNKLISNISKKCSIGCYPGDAGLSVLHYMSMSLPVIIHSDLKKHMGPEASYVKNNFNGIYFERNNQESLKSSILQILDSTILLSKLQNNAYETYLKITNPPLSERFLKIINEELNK